MRYCAACSGKAVGTRQLLLLGFGASVRCDACGARLKLKLLPQAAMHVLLSMATVFLLVVLTNRYGITGFVLAFIIPAILDFILTCFLPLEVIEKDGRFMK
jgi:predicted MFS family arabinose efflux permease